MVTEEAEMQLVYYSKNILIKLMPRYLLDALFGKSIFFIPQRITSAPSKIVGIREDCVAVRLAS